MDGLRETNARHELPQWSQQHPPSPTPFLRAFLRGESIHREACSYHASAALSPEKHRFEGGEEIFEQTAVSSQSCNVSPRRTTYYNSPA